MTKLTFDKTRHYTSNFKGVTDNNRYKIIQYLIILQRFK